MGGLKEKITGKKVYFDTNIFIYLYEGNSSLSARISELQLLIESSEIQVISSDLIYAEMLPPLVRQGNKKALQNLFDFLGESEAFDILPITRDISVYAGVLRGETGLKTPDAIHIASAKSSECDVFLTNDKNIKIPEDIEMVIFSD